jgi:hypothetical protein
METVIGRAQSQEDFAVSVGGQVDEVEPEKDQVSSILVDLDYRSPHGSRVGGSVGIKLLGEELKQLLKDHTFFFREEEYDKDRVRRTWICFDWR